jgi:hypothetical protein
MEQLLARPEADTTDQLKF